MTVVEGSVGDIGMKPMSGTLFAHPVTMRRQGNMVITTERTPFDIVAGALVDVDLVPGPALIMIEVGAHVRRSFRVTVPVAGPVQLADLLEDAYEYTPEVVSVVAGYRNDALAARNGAAQARDDAEGWAGSASGAAGAAAGSAGAASEEAEAASESRRLAGLSAVAADESAGVAGGHAVDASESKRLAEQAHSNTVATLSGLTGRVSTVEGALPSKADLVGGKVNPAQLPAEAMTDFLGVVGSQAAMLVLAGQRGDWCTRTDRGTDWQLIGEPSSALASWREKVYPASPVSSVNGKLGAVILSKADVGLGVVDNTSDAGKPISTAALTALGKKADLIGGRIDPAQLIGAGVSGTGIRVDTTVGTRVFVGETMIYGDTGWRNVADLLAEGLTLSPNLGRCRIRRVGNRVEFDLKVDVNVSGLTRIFASAIPGFSALGSYPMSAAIFHANARNVGASALSQGGYAGVFYPAGSPLQTGSTTAWPNPGCIAWTDSYPTADPWPTALPGAAA